MRVVYVGTNVSKRRKIQSKESDVIMLLFDRWNDFGIQTTFGTECQVNGKTIELGLIKILFEDEEATFVYLDKLVAKGWDGYFPVPSAKAYISTPVSLSFYEQLAGVVGLDTAKTTAMDLHDASYTVRIKEDEDALRLIATKPFETSLQREAGSIKAYLDGWKFFERQSLGVENQVFRFKTSTGEIADLPLTFATDSILPHEINVLIGPNGVGKSQLLHQMVSHWLGRSSKEDSQLGFTTVPNLNQMVVVSYSPFEFFPVDTAEDDERQDRDVYKYFGLRGRKKTLTASGRGSNAITLSDRFPRTNAANSLLDCLEGDQKFRSIREWSGRLKTLRKVLKNTIDFDDVAIAVAPNTELSEFYVDNPDYDDDDVSVVQRVSASNGKKEEVRLFPVSARLINHLKLEGLRRHILEQHGIVFLKDEKAVYLSSGQRLFAYIVINILGAIRRHSLILIDEPELFLHPTLEISFLRMLKTILRDFESKALIATHSLVVVRECPRTCVHVFDQTKDGLVIKRPPFETFGGDIQRISSYAFGDNAVSKPFEEWIREQLDQVGSAEALIQRMGNEINEELLIQIKAMGSGQW